MHTLPPPDIQTLVTQPPRKPSHTRRNIILGGIAAVVLVGIGAATNSSEPSAATPAATVATTAAPVTQAPTTQAPETTQAPRTTVPRTVPKVSSNREFGTAMGEHSDLMQSASEHMRDSGDAVSRRDIPEAIDLAETAGAEFRELLDIAEDLPSADSTLGRMVIKTFDVCAEANEVSAKALISMDTADLHRASGLLGECADSSNEAADITRRS